MSKVCESCGKRIELAGTGRPKRFCGQTCRKRASRAPKTGLPVELTSRARWVRRQGKRPLTAKGWFASVTDPRTWATHDEVKASTKGDGFGFVLGDGVGCIDLDHCIVNGELQGWARDILDRCPPTFVEVSQSGTGLHIFGLLREGKGRGQRGGDGVEFYSTGRYIAVTGDAFEKSVPRLGDLTEVVSTL